MHPASHSPQHSFVGINDLRARYGRGKTWVCSYVAQTGFSSEIGHRLWRLDHVLTFEVMQGISIEASSMVTPAVDVQVLDGLAASPASTFVGIKELMYRYGRGKTWACAFVAQRGFPGEIGYRVWRLDHVMAFEDALGTPVLPSLLDTRETDCKRAA